MNKEQAFKLVEDTINKIQDEGFTLKPVIQAQGHRAEAMLSIVEMSATEHKMYLANKPVEVKETKPAKDDK